jgi:hypothetical protein
MAYLSKPVVIATMISLLLIISNAQLVTPDLQPEPFIPPTPVLTPDTYLPTSVWTPEVASFATSPTPSSKCHKVTCTCQYKQAAEQIDKGCDESLGGCGNKTRNMESNNTRKRDATDF